MKETPMFEEVFTRLLRQHGVAQKLLIGALLCFIPIANFFAFGYLYRYAHGLRRSGDLILPEWEDWQGLFLDGLRFTVVWLAYWVLPLLLAFGVSRFLEEFRLGVLGYLVFWGVFFVSPVLFSSALYRFCMRADFRELLNIELIFRMTGAELPRSIVCALVFVAIFALLQPLYGLAFFAAFLLLVTYFMVRYRSLEYRGMPIL
ncbi:MAG: DUF4013 domain-containing protein [Opitutales bacterium]